MPNSDKCDLVFIQLADVTFLAIQTDFSLLDMIQSCNRSGPAGLKVFIHRTGPVWPHRLQYILHNSRKIIHIFLTIRFFFLSRSRIFLIFTEEHVVEDRSILNMKYLYLSLRNRRLCLFLIMMIMFI